MHEIKLWTKDKLQSMLSIRGILFAVFAIIILFSFCKHIKNAFNYTTITPLTSEPIQLSNGIHYTEEIKKYNDSIKSLKIKFGTNARSNEGRLIVTIKTDDEILQSWNVETKNLVDNAFQLFEVDDSIFLESDNHYYLDIFEEYNGDNNIAVYSSNSGEYIYTGDSIYNGKSFCCQWTLENTSIRNHFFPLYVTVVIMLLLFTAVFVNFNNYSIPKSVLVCIIVILLFRMFDYDLFQNFATRTTVSDYQQNDNSQVLFSGSQKDYKITVNRTSFSTIEFFLEGDNRSGLHVDVMNEKTNQYYYSQDIASEYIIGDERTGKTAVIIDVPQGFPKGSYLVTISNKGKEDIQINVLEDGRLNTLIEKETFIAHRMALFIIFMLVGTFIFLMGYAIKKLSIEKIYLISVIPLTIAYLILFVPWSQPDTGAHFLATYRLSNIVMGYVEEQEWYGREEDIEFFSNVWGKDNNPSLKSYSGIMHNFHIKCEKNNMINFPTHAVHMEYYSIINYLPEVLGLSLGRILNLSTILSIYLGRLFIMILYIGTTYHAIRKIPSGKSIIATVSSLPMCLMMSSAISYDPMVIISTLNFIASILYLSQNRDSKPALIETMGWVFLIGAVKGGGYLILLPLIFMLVNKKEWKKNTIRMSCILISGIISVIIFDKILPDGTELFQFGTDGNGKMTASYALQEPIKFLDMCIETYLRNLDLLAINTAGTHLAWLEETLPTTIIVLLLILGGIYSIFEKDNMEFRKMDKYIFILVILIGIISTPAMLLSWTTIGARWVDGLQGRYYLPLLPLAIYVMTKFSLHHPLEQDGEVIRNKTVMLFEILSFIAVYYMLRLYLVR